MQEIVDEVQSANPGFLIVLEATRDLNGDWDPERLKQAVSNLLINAIQHGEGKSVEVSVKSEDSLVSVEVHNEGPPIPKELLGIIFDPLVQSGSSDQKRTGLGLGLFIAREIVSAHKGMLEVNSSKDTGTTFSMRLPSHLP